MNTQTTKNYFTDGGDPLVIGGKLTVEAGAEVTGIEGTVTAAANQAASTATSVAALVADLCFM